MQNHKSLACLYLGKSRHTALSLSNPAKREGKGISSLRQSAISRFQKDSCRHSRIDKIRGTSNPVGAQKMTPRARLTARQRGSRSLRPRKSTDNNLGSLFLAETCKAIVVYCAALAAGALVLSL